MRAINHRTEYSRFIEQSMISKVQEHCKRWLRNDSGGRPNMLSPQLSKKLARSQENIKFIYQQMEKTINKDLSVEKNQIKTQMASHR